jgi:hypothetical protein
MARYAHLPVFQSAYKFNLEINLRVGNFPRLYRYSNGEKLKNSAFELMDIIIKANSSLEKIGFLAKAEEILENLKLQIRLCFDLKIMGTKGFEHCVRLMDEIGRQLCKWKEWAKNPPKLSLGNQKL